MNNRRIITVYANFANAGGAQDVALQLAHALNEDEMPVVLTNTPAGLIDERYRGMAKYEPCTVENILRYASRGALFLSHHRKNTTLLMLVKRLVFWKHLQVIHVAHNTFFSLRRVTLLPKVSVAVSQAVKKNMIDYFGVHPDRVCVILNGMKDMSDYQNYVFRGGQNEDINILLPGRICPVKQQLDLARSLKGRLAGNIRISFAGNGPQAEELRKVIADDPCLEYIGFVDISKVMPRYDYVMLYSKKEGLGLALVQGCMYGKPLITNCIDAVLEVNQDGYNGYAYPSMEELADKLNHLPHRDSDEYKLLAKNSRQKYLDCFTEQHMIEQYKHVIEEVMR